MKKALIALIILFLSPAGSFSDTIILKDGSKIETQGTWEQDGKIVYFKNGKIQSGIEKADILTIQKNQPYEKINPAENKKTGRIVERKPDFNLIRYNLKNMTSVQWDNYTKSLKGQSVKWTGWISDVDSQFFGGYKISVDMDPPGSLSVSDVYINNLDKKFAVIFFKKPKNSLFWKN